MTAYPFQEAIAFDPYSRSVAPGTGQVFALSDVSYLSPLSPTDENGLPVQLAADTATGYLPTFYVEGHPEVVFKSGDWTKILVTTKALEGVPGERGTDGTHGTDGVDGRQGLPGVNAVPAAEATAAYLADPDGPAHAALNAQSAEAIQDDSSEVGAALKSVLTVREQKTVLYGHQFGIRSNGVDADDVAFQAAVDYMGQHGGALQLEGPRTRLNGTITVPPNFAMAKSRANKDSVFNLTPDATNSVIETYSPTLVFTPAGTGTDLVLDLSGVTFKNRLGSQSTPTLFGGTNITVSRSLILGISTYNYATVFDARFRQVSKILASYFYSVKQAVVSRGFVDSYAALNYFNGNSASGHNATGFVLDSGSSHTTIALNFFDFFKYGVRYDAAGSGRTMITNNIFDYCYNGVGANRPAGGARGPALTDLKIMGNTFNRPNKTLAASYFSAMDDDMNTQPWAAVAAPFGARWVGIENNSVIQADLGYMIRSYPMEEVRESGTTWRETTNRILYSPSVAAAPPVYLESLDNQRVTTLPNPTLTNTSGLTTTFDKQRLIYNGKPIWNDAGAWRDMLGTVVT